MSTLLMMILIVLALAGCRLGLPKTAASVSSTAVTRQALACLTNEAESLKGRIVVLAGRRCARDGKPESACA